MKDANKHFGDRKYVKFFFLAVCILLAYKILFSFESVLGWINQILNIMSPFIAGFVIAYCINIPCVLLENKIAGIKIGFLKKRARLISIIVCYVLLILFVVFGLSRLIPMIYNSLYQLITQLPENIENSLIYFSNQSYAETFGLIETIDRLLETQPWNDLRNDLSRLLPIPGKVSDGLQLITNFFSMFFKVILTAVSSIYFIVEYDGIKEYIKRVIRSFSSLEKRKTALKYTHLIDTSFRKFLSCQFLDSFILGTITTVEFFIIEFFTTGPSYALILGIMLGVVNIIPYFGSIVGSIVAIAIMGFTGGLQVAVITAIVLLITQQFDGNFINPKIMGTSFSVSPILIIIGITVGGAVGRIIGGGAVGMITGMIFAVPVVNVMKTVFEEYMQSKTTVKESAETDGAGGAPAAAD
ncbi:MAG: AI-2E family transporter [Oscillospiraceae bacterium]|jgi:predicted PurR-regulated permease PerM|nr:AI-2E family transporter [Oscillospiraceae bacterium]